MRRVLMIIVLMSLLVSCGEKNNNANMENKLEDKPQIHTILKPKSIKQKYGVLAKFIKTDLSLKDDKILQEILKQRQEKIKEINKILTKAKKEGDFEEKMEEVAVMREAIKNTILPYVTENKKELFNKTCDSGNDKLRKIFG